MALNVTRSTLLRCSRTSRLSATSFLFPTAATSSNRLETAACPIRLFSSPQEHLIGSSTSNCYSARVSFSTDTSEKKGIFGRIKDTFTDRAEKKRAAKYAEQLQKMANSEVWDLKSFAEDINSSISGWRSKIPGMSNVKQVKAVKETQKLINALISEVGGDTTAADLAELGRKEKLKISLKSGIPVEDLNILFRQFQAMEVVHRVLRYRKLNGKPIPTDEESVKAAIQSDGPKVMTKEQKKEMQSNQAKKSMRRFR